MSFRRQIQQEAARPSASLDLSSHHKSMTGHLDVKAVWRRVLTSTKGPPSQGVAMLTERERSHNLFLLSYLCSGSPFSPLPLCLSFLSLVFSSSPHPPTVITPAPSSIAPGVAGQRQLLGENLQRTHGGALLTVSLRGNIRL